MSDKLIADAKSKLDDLEQRIQKAKGSIGGLDDDAARAWKDMVDKHEDIRRKINAGGEHSPNAAEGIRYDVDILTSSFEKWVARVEGKFAK
jgi:hypothetical protein